MSNDDNSMVDKIKNVGKDILEVATEPLAGGVELVKNTVNTAKYLYRDIGNAITGNNDNSSNSSSNNGGESGQSLAGGESSGQSSAEESSDSESSGEEQEPDPAFIPGTEECNARLAELEKTYILHTAVLYCDKAARFSHLVTPKSHGEFIHGTAQLNVGDCIPNKNILSFGVCTSPKNPSVQEAAKKILNDVREEHKNDFTTKVCNLFGKKTAADKVCDNETDSLAASCAGVCDPQIFVDEWPDGQEDVLIEGKKALIGKCKLSCGYGGEIVIFTSGQRE